MTDKKRYTLRVVIFFAIFAVLFSTMLYLFSNHPDHRIYQLIGGFYEEEENSLDGVYLGSSNCYAFWNPLVAWENYGIAVYPYASGSQPFYATEYLIREARKTQPDALYIVNLNNVESDNLDAEAIHSLVNYMPESENKDALISYLGGLIGYSKLENLEFRFTWIRSREYWTDYLEYGFFPKLNGLKGVSQYDEYLKNVVDISSSYILTEEQEDLPEELTKSIDSLLDYCESEKVNILFVSVPRAESGEYALARINRAAEMVEERGYEVLYLTDAYEEIGLDLMQDYYNTLHTNIHGSIKFTNYLAQYLTKTQALSGIHSETSSGSWDSAWETYSETIATHVIDCELDYNHRDFSLSAAQNISAQSEEAGIKVSWDNVEGADGYVLYRIANDGSAWKAISDCITENTYTDTDCAEGMKYRYTVVPVRVENGETYYGNFLYNGIVAAR